LFWIHSTGPIGCLPFNYFSYEPKKGNIDANGCVNPQNKIAQEFNKKLKDQVFQLRTNLTLAKFTYVDMYKAKYELISNARNQGDTIDKLGIWTMCSHTQFRDCMQPPHR
jgi:hypothetical protein